MTDAPVPLWLRVVAVVLFVFLLLPVVVVVLASFSSTAYLTVPPQGLTLQWFAKVLQRPGLRRLDRPQPQARGRVHRAGDGAGGPGLLRAASPMVPFSAAITSMP